MEKYRLWRLGKLPAVPMVTPRRGSEGSTQSPAWFPSIPTHHLKSHSRLCPGVSWCVIDRKEEGQAVTWQSTFRKRKGQEDRTKHDYWKSESKDTALGIMYRMGREKLLKKGGYKKSRWQKAQHTGVWLLSSAQHRPAQIFPTQVLLTSKYWRWRAQTTRQTSIQALCESHSVRFNERNLFRRNHQKVLGSTEQELQSHWPHSPHWFLSKEVLSISIFQHQFDFFIYFCCCWRKKS